MMMYYLSAATWLGFLLCACDAVLSRHWLNDQIVLVTAPYETTMMYDCVGLYKMSSYTFSRRNVWVNDEKGCFIAAESKSQHNWIIDLTVRLPYYHNDNKVLPVTYYDLSLTDTTLLSWNPSSASLYGTWTVFDRFRGPLPICEVSRFTGTPTFHVLHATDGEEGERDCAGFFDLVSLKEGGRSVYRNDDKQCYLSDVSGPLGQWRVYSPLCSAVKYGGAVVRGASPDASMVDAVLDGIVDERRLGSTAVRFQQSSCSTQSYVDIDLGSRNAVVGVRFWMTTGGGEYCNQLISLSSTGDFEGEQITIFSCTSREQCGAFDKQGKYISLDTATNARYVRVASSKHDLSENFYLLEVQIFTAECDMDTAGKHLPPISDFYVPVQRRTDHSDGEVGEFECNTVGGVVSAGDFCFFSPSTTTLNWRQAEVFCASSYPGGHLASITSTADQSLLEGFDSDEMNVWVGMSRLSVGNHYRWTDNTEVIGDFVTWATESSTGDGSCASFLNGELSWHDCNSELAFICMVPLTHTPPSRRACATDSKGNPLRDRDEYCYFTPAAVTPRTSDAVLTWSDANEACNRLGDGLATVQSAGESDELHRLFLSITGEDEAVRDSISFFIGLSDTAVEGVFMWTGDDAHNQFEHWAHGQPNDWHGQDCVGIRQSSSRWFDEFCNMASPYACMLAPRSSVIGNPTEACEVDPNGLPQRFANASCFFVPTTTRFVNPRLNWTAANHSCLHFGGTLATVRSTAESEVLYRLLHEVPGDPGILWLGLSDAEEEGHFEWADGSAEGFRHWAPGQPNNWLGNQHCAGLHRGTPEWFDDHCALESAYACALPPLLSPLLQDSVPQATCTFLNGDVITLTPDTSISTHLVAFRGQGEPCFFVPGDEQEARQKRTWGDAERECRMYGGHLAAAFSPQENEFLAKNMSAKYNWEDPQDVMSFWIGASDSDEEGLFTWSNGHSLFAFSSWDQAQPNNWQSTQHCVSMSVSDSSWNDEACSAMRAYTCEIRPVAFSPGNTDVLVPTSRYQIRAFTGTYAFHVDLPSGSGLFGNFSHCSGVYLLSRSDRINNQPVYVNTAEHCFIAKTLFNDWSIDDMHFLAEAVQAPDYNLTSRDMRYPGYYAGTGVFSLSPGVLDAGPWHQLNVVVVPFE